MFFNKTQKLLVIAVSVATGAFIVALPIIYGLYTPQEPYLIPLTQKVNNIVAVGMIVSFACPAVVAYHNHRWKMQVDENIPKLLRDLTESVRSGQTLARALGEASRRDYGPLSKELEYAVSKFVLGKPLEDSMIDMAHRLNRPDALRISTVLIEAYRSGGSAVDILEKSAELFSGIDQYREEKRTQMRPYVLIVYMAVAVFLVISYIILTQFLSPLSSYQSPTTEEAPSFLGAVLDIRYYSSILFWASLLESIFAGLAAGKISEGTVSNGLRHSLILSIITVVFFNVLVSPAGGG